MNHRHFILNKPYGFLSQFTTNQYKQRNKKLLGALFDFPDGTMAIGRLDEASEGIILLTTDGQVSEDVRSQHLEKQYFVQVDGIPAKEALQKLAAGVEIGIHGKRYTTLPCTVRRLVKDPGFGERSRRVRDDRHGPSSWLDITITEGKFRQVRKMTAAIGVPTLRLVRVRYGNIQLGDMKWGDVLEVGGFYGKEHKE